MTANVQTFTLTNGIIMSSAMFTNHFAVPGFVRKCRAKFPEVFLSLFDVFLFQDADLELNPDDIPMMLEMMRKFNVEFVNGSRYLPGVIRPMASYRRYLANKFFTFLTSVLINVKLTDMACGYKLIHRNLLSKITIKEKKFGIEAELIIKALRIKKNNIIEVPVQYTPRFEQEGKKLKNIDAFKILWTIIKYSV